jgi:mono/diheme cytochrome c family protein
VSAIAAGRYITEIGGCNDCHTSGYMEAGGNMPDSLRLMGDAMGIRGPWGTSYPANLRLTVQRMSADEFVTMVRARNGLPPMPWPSLHKMNEQDLRAIYAYIKSLGGRGQPAPAAVPPNVEPKTPYVLFEPTFPKGMKPVAP